MAIICGDLNLKIPSFDLSLSGLTELLSKLAIPGKPGSPSAAPPQNDAPPSSLLPAIPDLDIDLGLEIPQIGCLVNLPKQCPAKSPADQFIGDSRFTKAIA
jgi:hypothetical protein